MDFDGALESPEPTESADTPPPRLGIIHLLAWLTVSAVLFGFERSMQTLEKAANHHDMIAVRYLLLDSIRVVALAAGVVGLAVLVRWRRSERTQPLAPGQWMLFIVGSGWLLRYGLELERRTVMACMDRPNASTVYLPELAFTALIAIAQMFVFAVVARRHANKGGWHGIFIMLAIASAAQATLDAILLLIIGQWLKPPFPLFEFFYPAPAALATFVVAPTVLYAIYDAFRFRRDWLHGIGVALVFCNGLMWIGYWAATHLVR